MISAGEGATKRAESAVESRVELGVEDATGGEKSNKVRPVRTSLPELDPHVVTSMAAHVHKTKRFAIFLPIGRSSLKVACSLFLSTWGSHRSKTSAPPAPTRQKDKDISGPGAKK